jgi:uncharacterized protein YndB with AHSA1/START domain
VRDVTEALAVHLDTLIEAPPERVWRALATENAWRQWFNAKTQLEPRLGGRFRVEGTHAGAAYVFVGEVVVFEPPREIAVTWIPVGTDWPFPDVHSIVRFTLAPEGNGTRVRVSHEGFERLPEPFRTKEFQDFSRGWNADEELAWLRDYVERGVSHFA